MAEEQNRSASPWERITYTVYLRLGTIIASSLTLVAGAIALNAAMKYDLAEEEALVESEERPADGSLVHQTLAVTGILTATAAVTLLLQTGLVLASKCCVYIYEPSLSTLVYLKLTDFLASSVLLLAATGSTTVEGLVAYHWANMDQDSADDDNLFKVVAGSTAFGFLLGLLLCALCFVTFYNYHSSQRSLSPKTIRNIVAV